MRTGVIILAHGSRGEKGESEVELVLHRTAIELKPLLIQSTDIIGAALQFNHPSLEEAVTLVSLKGIKRIVIAPYFLFAGRHITEDIPQLISKLKDKYPDTEFLLTDNLGQNESFSNLMAKRIKDKVPDLSPRIAGKPVNAIERESMEIIDSLVAFPEKLSAEEKTVVKRIIHASGDIQIAQMVRFSSGAISRGLDAISRGSSIITDVHMVMSGINSHLVEALGCSLYCAMDGIHVAEGEEKLVITRAAWAIDNLGTKLNGAVVVIGNAPTALLSLLNSIDTRKINPALVIGMPVGFVKAEESKEELMKHDVPYITVTGTRGGSAMAVAAVNALLRIAAEKHLNNSKYHMKEKP